MKRTPVLASTAAAVALLFSTGAAAASSSGTIDEARDATQIGWETGLDYVSVTVSLVGPDGYSSSRVFGRGEALTVSPHDRDGNALPDGDYLYEVRVSERPLGEVPQATLHNGSFRIAGGTFVAPPARARQPDPGANVVPCFPPLTCGAFVDGTNKFTSVCVGDECLDDDVDRRGTATLVLSDVTDGNTNPPRLLMRAGADSLEAGAYAAWQLGIEDGTGGSYPTGALLLSDEQNTTSPMTFLPSAQTNSIVVGTSGVGIGTATPDATLHVVNTGGPNSAKLVNGTLTVERDDSGTANIKFGVSGGASQVWAFQNNGTTGVFAIRDASAMASPFKFFPGTPSDTLVLKPGGGGGGGIVDVKGSIFQRGGLLHADYVFADDYELASIEEHAAAMWKNNHLPAVPKGKVDDVGREVLEIGAHRRGILEELEIAHIYIQQLNDELAAKHATLAALEAAVQAKASRLDGVEEQNAELRARLDRLEAALLER